MFIGGKPGTGKTASVMDVVREMERKAEEGSVPRFQFVEVNGLRLPTPKHAYVRLHEVRCRPAAAGRPAAGKRHSLATQWRRGVGLPVYLARLHMLVAGGIEGGDPPRGPLLFPLLFM